MKWHRLLGKENIYLIFNHQNTQLFCCLWTAQWMELRPSFCCLICWLNVCCCSDSLYPLGWLIPLFGAPSHGNCVPRCCCKHVLWLVVCCLLTFALSCVSGGCNSVLYPLGWLIPLFGAPSHGKWTGLLFLRSALAGGLWLAALVAEGSCFISLCFSFGICWFLFSVCSFIVSLFFLEIW